MFRLRSIGIEKRRVVVGMSPLGVKDCDYYRVLNKP